MRSAPVWDHNEQRFVGMVTITDFINILLQQHGAHGNMEELEEHKITTWRGVNVLNRGYHTISMRTLRFVGSYTRLSLICYVCSPDGVCGSFFENLIYFSHYDLYVLTMHKGLC